MIIKSFGNSTFGIEFNITAANKGLMRMKGGKHGRWGAVIPNTERKGSILEENNGVYVPARKIFYYPFLE